MPDAAAIRIDLSESRLARRLRDLAFVLTVMAGGACLWALVIAPSGGRLVAALGAFALLAVAARRRASPGSRELSIAADGRLHWRHGDGRTALAMPRYCSSALFCLQGPHGVLAVWRDAMPAPAWRRLLVACRWPQRGEPEQSGGSSRLGDRTK